MNKYFSLIVLLYGVCLFNGCGGTSGAGNSTTRSDAEAHLSRDGTAVIFTIPFCPTLGGCSRQRMFFPASSHRRHIGDGAQCHPRAG